MKIKYSHAAGITGFLPPGDDLAEHAASAYGFALNTSERLNVWHDGPQFAQAIREAVSDLEPRNAAVNNHLETLN